MPIGALKGTLSAAISNITNPVSATGSVVVAIGDLVYFMLAEQTNLTVTTVSDNLGHSYTALNAGTDAGALSGRAYYVIVTTAGTLTSIDATTTASNDNCVVIAAVIAGPFLASGALDANPANDTTDTTSPFTCPATGTLGQGYEVVMCWGVRDTNSAFTATAPNLLALNLATQAVLTAAVGYQAVLSTGSVAPQFAGSSATTIVLGTSSFKLAPVVGWEQVGLVNPYVPGPRGGGASPS